MMTLLQDLRIGARTLLKARGYTATVIVTLALAIGANSVIFSFANVLLIKPLPIADPATLGWLYSLDPQRTNMRGRLSYPDFDDLRRGARSFRTLSAVTTDSVTLTGLGEPRRLQAQKVSASLFDTWGLVPLLGRPIATSEDVAGAPCVLVLSHKLWKAQFQSDPAIVSRTMAIDGRPCTVVGVLSPAIEFGNLSLNDVWMPLAVDPAAARRDERRYSVVGRLGAGVTHEQADAEVKAIMTRLAAEHASTNRAWSVRVAQTREAIAGSDTWVSLALLGLVVGSVLLIACANLANLALARTAGRRRELAVRTALGASRWRVVQQLVTESLMLGLIGGVAGVGVAEIGLRGIRAIAFEPIFALIVVDRNVMLFAAALSILTPLLFTLLPALDASDHTVSDALKEGGRSAGGVHARRSRHALVVAQVSLAFTLLVVSLLIVRSMIAVVHLDLGFDPGRLLVARLEVPSWKFGDDDGVRRTSEAIVDRIRRVPGVEAAAATSVLPVLTVGSRVALDIAGRSAASPIDRPWALRVAVGDDFFRATGIPVQSGRAFERADRTAAEPVAIVSAETSRRYWGSPDAALGSRIALARASAAEPEIWLRVVGIAGDTASDSNPSEVAKPNPLVYLPLAQQPTRDLGLIVRSSRPAGVAAGVRVAIRDIEPDAPVFQMRTLPEALDNELASNWVITSMFAAFALLALVLASTGLYAVVAYSVSQRQHEIGVRMALGALPLDIRRLVLSQGGRLIGIGGAIGLVAALALSRAIRSLLFGVTPSDPATYAIALAVVLISSGLAMWLPARHAARVDPIASLRSE